MSVIQSPSGWSYRQEQEVSWGEVTCAGCGNHLDDDYPIVNDSEGYAYHPGCLPDTSSNQGE